MSEPRLHSWSTVLMGSPIVLSLFTDDRDLAARVFRLIQRYEDALTVNRAVSQVMAVNHAAGLHPVKVSGAVYDLIRCAKAASMVNDSAFNLAIGPLVKLWRIGFQGSRVPAREEIAERLPLTRPAEVILNDHERSVFLARAGMEIDLGAIAKGYIADRVRDFLRQQGVEQALINLGGNVLALGSPQGAWSVGVKKPFAAADGLVGVVDVANKSVVTSGIYERWFEQDGKRWHHILDPRTGYPLDNDIESVTIVSDDSLDGDVWTTLIYGFGVEKGCAVLRQREDIEAIFITKNREVILSSQRQFRFTLLDDSYRISGCTA
nr:FAD:protein FMN transferase [Superficieibacter sp.]